MAFQTLANNWQHDVDLTCGLANQIAGNQTPDWCLGRLGVETLQ